MDDYPPPVAKLLQLGAPRTHDIWRDYTHFGLTVEHIPDLLRLATESRDDESRGREVWGPIHAWRALGQLRALEAVTPLLEMVSREDEGFDDWETEDIPEVLALIGPPAIPALRAWLASDAEYRMAAAEALKLIPINHPEVRAECVQALMHQLEVEEDDSSLNGWIVSMLLDLKATEAVPVMEKAFAEDRVDVSIAGEMDNVRYELGLTDQEPKRWYAPPGWGDPEDEDLDEDDIPDEYEPLSPYGGQTPKERAAERKKKRKAAAKERKRKRKK